MNCQSTSEQPFEELFIQINRNMKSIDRGFRDRQGADIINKYECRGLAYFDSQTCKFPANIIVIVFIELETIFSLLLIDVMASTQPENHDALCVTPCYWLFIRHCVPLRH